MDQHPIREFDAASLATTNPFHGDEDDAMTTGPSLPVIVVEFETRLWQAHRRKPSAF